MLKINEGDYSYASAYIRAVENKLLGTVQYERMLESPGAEEAFKVLSEAEYGLGGGNSSGIHSYEVLLSEELKKCYMLLEEIIPDTKIIKAFQRRNDYFNVKVLLKAELSGQKTPDILVGTGTFEKEEIKRIIRERAYGELTPVMSNAVADVYDAFSRMHDPQAIDLILDKASYQQFSTDLKEIDSPFLKKLAQIITDTANIKMYVRTRLLNREWSFIKKLLLETGMLSEKIFSENIDKPIDLFVDSLRSSPYGAAVQKGWELFRIRKNISELEKQMDDYLMKFIREAKMVTMGVEPLVAYLFAKEAEIRNVRIILTGRINRLPYETIRERLRLGYV